MHTWLLFGSSPSCHLCEIHKYIGCLGMLWYYSFHSLELRGPKPITARQCPKHKASSINTRFVKELSCPELWPLGFTDFGMDSPHPTSVPDLNNAFVVEWSHISTNTLQHLVKNLPGIVFILTVKLNSVGHETFNKHILVVKSRVHIRLTI